MERPRQSRWHSVELDGQPDRLSVPCCLCSRSLPPWLTLSDFADPAAINSSFVHTTARSTFTFTNNPATVALEANFVSPVTPADVFRQSIPFSYLSLTVTSLDGRPHSVQVYTDVNGLWLADKEEEQLEWEHKREPDWNGIRFRLTHQRPFTEEQIEKGWTADRILSGDAWYAAGIDKAIATTFSAGEDATTTRRLFASQGQLDNGSRRIPRHATTTTRTRDRANSSAIVDEPVFAFAHDFGAVNAATPADARTQLLAIGHVRDPLVQYMAQGNRTVDMRPLWRSAFDSTESLVKFFLGDFDHAVRASDAFNAKLYSDARKVDGDEYAHVVSVSTRQISAALEAVWDEEPLNSDTGAKNGRLVAFSPVTGDPIPAMSKLFPKSLGRKKIAPEILLSAHPWFFLASHAQRSELERQLWNGRRARPFPPVHGLCSAIARAPLDRTNAPVRRDGALHASSPTSRYRRSLPSLHWTVSWIPSATVPTLPFRSRYLLVGRSCVPPLCFSRAATIFCTQGCRSKRQATCSIWCSRACGAAIRARTRPS